MMGDARRSIPSSRWVLVVRVGFSLVLLFAIWTFVDLGAALTAIAGADGGLLLLLLALFGLERLAVAYRWFIVLPAARRPAYLGMLNVVMTSSFLGMFLPGTLGFDALRVAGVARSTRDMAMTLASFAVERVQAIAAMFMLVLLGLAMLPHPIEGGRVIALAATAGLVLLGLLVAAALSETLYRGTGRLAKRLAAPKAAAWLNKLRANFGFYRDRPGLLLGGMVLGVAFQFLRVLEGVVAGMAIGLDLPLSVWLSVMPIVMIALLLPLSFIGLGLRDLSLVVMLGLFGVVAEQAVAVSLLLALMTVLASLPGAWVFMRRGLTASH